MRHIYFVFSSCTIHNANVYYTYYIPIRHIPVWFYFEREPQFIRLWHLRGRARSCFNCTQNIQFHFVPSSSFSVFLSILLMVLCLCAREKRLKRSKKKAKTILIRINKSLFKALYQFDESAIQLRSAQLKNSEMIEMHFMYLQWESFSCALAHSVKNVTQSNNLIDRL